MSEDEWNNLRASFFFPPFLLRPSVRGCALIEGDYGERTAEVSNMVGNRAKKPRLEGRSYVVPDSILVGARDSTMNESTLAEEQMVRSLP
jgi:hypothetical protein